MRCKSHKKSLEKELPQKKSSHSMGALPDYWGWCLVGALVSPKQRAEQSSRSGRHTLSHATSSQPTAIPTPDDTPVSSPCSPQFLADNSNIFWPLFVVVITTFLFPFQVFFPFTISSLNERAMLLSDLPGSKWGLSGQRSPFTEFYIHCLTLSPLNEKAMLLADLPNGALLLTGRS